MNLHEYQAKQLMQRYHIGVPPMIIVHSLEEVSQKLTEQSGSGWVVKAQVHAGGRGKAGGVKFADTASDVRELTSAMLGQRLVTHQSPQGQPVNCVLIQEKTAIKAELYLSMVLDRGNKMLTVIASSEGGMDIEEVAATSPHKIHSVNINPIIGLQNYQCRQISDVLGLDKQQSLELAEILQNFYRLFMEKDLSLIEINPLAIDDSGRLLCLDAKITVDDNALYRQKELHQWQDETQDDEKELLAREYDLNYVPLEGNIACMVNGAGLAMATMDIIKLYGGEPANFLDVGGGTTAEKVAEAFKLIVADSNVKAVLINIFGGIVRCDLIAEGIISAAREVGVNIPLVVRLEGTNVEQGKSVLAASTLSIITADDLADAAEKVVAAANG